MPRLSIDRRPLMCNAARLTPYITWTLALSLTVLPLPAQAQDQRNSVIRTTTRLVQLNVVVLDNHKHPVSDLSQSDFVVFDNGREQNLSHFSVSSTAPMNTPSRPSPRVITNRPEQPGERSTTATVILVDELVLEPNINRQETPEGAKMPMRSARLAVLKLLATLRPGEQVALYALRRKGVVVIHDLTDDSEALIDAAQTIGTGLLKGGMLPSGGKPPAVQMAERPTRRGHDSNSEDLREVLEEGRVAYLLGYYPGDVAWDG